MFRQTLQRIRLKSVFLCQMQHPARRFEPADTSPSLNRAAVWPHISGCGGKDNPQKPFPATSGNEISAGSGCETSVICRICRQRGSYGKICRSASRLRCQSSAYRLTAAHHSTTRCAARCRTASKGRPAMVPGSAKVRCKVPCTPAAVLCCTTRFRISFSGRHPPLPAAALRGALRPMPPAYGSR